jgi:hypothetical protein
MEIHYHPKHQGKPRKIGEYLSEFFIIFIAITGSFFAENLREHFVDRHSEKEYMESMLQDLKADTTSIGMILRLNIVQQKGLDSLLRVMEEGLTGSRLNRFYYYDLTYTIGYNGFVPSDKTISQLKNTGGIRLIRNGPVSDAIIHYDKATSVIISQSALLASQFNKTLDQKKEIVDLLTIRKHHSGGTMRSLLKSSDHPALLTDSKRVIHSYYFDITMFKGAISSYNDKLANLMEESASDIRLIQKEYKME